jgi:hypothetical protein
MLRQKVEQKEHDCHAQHGWYIVSIRPLEKWGDFSFLFLLTCPFSILWEGRGIGKWNRLKRRWSWYHLVVEACMMHAALMLDGVVLRVQRSRRVWSSGIVLGFPGAMFLRWLAGRQVLLFADIALFFIAFRESGCYTCVVRCEAGGRIIPWSIILKH